MAEGWEAGEGAGRGVGLGQGGRQVAEEGPDLGPGRASPQSYSGSCEGLAPRAGPPLASTDGPPSPEHPSGPVLG